MFYSTTTNTYIQEGTAFEINGIQYPQNWLNLSIDAPFGAYRAAALEP
jgi:hypothetical protein